MVYPSKEKAQRLVIRGGVRKTASKFNRDGQKERNPRKGIEICTSWRVPSFNPLVRKKGILERGLKSSINTRSPDLTLKWSERKESSKGD